MTDDKNKNISREDLEAALTEGWRFEADQTQIDGFMVLVDAHVAGRAEQLTADDLHVTNSLARQVLDTGGRMRLDPAGRLDEPDNPLATRADIEALRVAVASRARRGVDLGPLADVLSRQEDRIMSKLVFTEAELKTRLDEFRADMDTMARHGQDAEIVMSTVRSGLTDLQQALAVIRKWAPEEPWDRRLAEVSLQVVTLQQKLDTLIGILQKLADNAERQDKDHADEEISIGGQLQGILVQLETLTSTMLAARTYGQTVITRRGIMDLGDRIAHALAAWADETDDDAETGFRTPAEEELEHFERDLLNGMPPRTEPEEPEHLIPFETVPADVEYVFEVDDDLPQPQYGEGLQPGCYFEPDGKIRCRVCQQAKSTDDYYKDRQSRTGWKSICKLCEQTRKVAAERARLPRGDMSF